MRILLVNTFDVVGGPGRWAYMMHRDFLQSGIDSIYLVDNKISSDGTIVGYGGKYKNIRSRIKQIIEYLPLVSYPHWKRTIFSTGMAPFDINKIVAELKPDIVHLNWINRGFINIKSLSQIKVPIVWTMHDMWPFTGGCHYDEGCGRYRLGCGSCPMLGSHKDSDLSRTITELKNKYWQNIDLTMVTPSRWLLQCAQKSKLFQNKRVEHIPVGIDVGVFRSINKVEARKQLSLPLDKKLILFGAINAVKDQRKGFKYLLEALNLLNNQDSNIELVIFGSSEFENKINFKLKSHFFGSIKDNKKMALLYSAADVFVAPSIQDNMPATVMESLACGTPVASFNIGGMPDMIEHKKNGYLAKPFDVVDLTNGIQWILENDERHIGLSQRGRNKIEEEFDIKIIANRYIDLYKNILSSHDL